MNSDLARQLETAMIAAKEAGGILLRCRKRHLEVQTKQDGSLVSEADLAAEQCILEILQAAFPDYAVLAEEKGPAGPKDQPCWVIDPLDGTTNYLHGLPTFAVSIALQESGVTQLAVVYLPLTAELFSAVPGRPAHLNAKPIRVSATALLEDALLDVYLDRHSGQDKIEEGLKLLEFVVRKCHGRFKNLGSTASILCYVAAGRLDGYLKNGAKVWDVAAGGLIVQQAGGQFTDLRGNPWGSKGSSLLATNGHLHPRILESLK